MRYLIVLALLTLAACGSGGSDGKRSGNITGPTNPSVVVNCQDIVGGGGNTTTTVTVDCGTRDSNNSAPEPKGDLPE